MHDKRPRRIRILSETEILDDLERYRKTALDLGASDAKVIASEKVHVDKRVSVKCMIPKCPEYGTCAHCPPHTLQTDEMRELVEAFRYGLLIKLDIQTSLIVGDTLLAIDDKGNFDLSKVQESLRSYRKIADIVTEIESQAFYDGHYLSVSFSAGSCHAIFCNFQDCQVLKNQPCRFFLRARPSMEASSMNVYRMATEAGWDIFPIGSDCNPVNVPQGTLVGLVLVD